MLHYGVANEVYESFKAETKAECQDEQEQVTVNHEAANDEQEQEKKEENTANDPNFSHYDFRGKDNDKYYRIPGAGPYRINK